MPLFWLIVFIDPLRNFGIFIDEFIIRIIMITVGLCFPIIVIYMAYIASVIIKSIELNRSAKFPEHALLVIGILFFPIGIWFIQPKINKIFT